MTQRIWDTLRVKVRAGMDRMIIKTGYDGHEYGSSVEDSRRLLAAQILCEGMTTEQRKAVFDALPQGWV